MSGCLHKLSSTIAKKITKLSSNEEKLRGFKVIFLDKNPHMYRINSYLKARRREANIHAYLFK